VTFLLLFTFVAWPKCGAAFLSPFLHYKRVLTFGRNVISRSACSSGGGSSSVAATTSAGENVPTLGFLSFDLDDTLFPISVTVNDANARQINHMNELFASMGIPNSSSSISIPDFLRTARDIRRDLQHQQPVTYTALRKMAIRRELESRLGSSVVHDNIEQVVDDIFDVWLQERHAAAERYLFADAVRSLESLRARYPDVCIAAITNGRGNPLHMTASTLAEHFDFCVSGEDDDVFPNRKPHRGIYEVALERYQQLYPHHQYSSNNNTNNNRSTIWCHVGDCLVNDVGASAACGAYAVWYCPDDQNALESKTAALRLQRGSSNNNNNKEPSWSTATESDMKQRKQLAIGAEEKVATRISSLSELEGAIEVLLASAQARSLKCR
jgi:FMN phosphatase YigB (HAD superfamily)